MPTGARSPFTDTTKLVVDGTNLLYRLGGGAQAAPPAAIIGRLRAAVPEPVQIELVFDGMGHGVFGRLAQGMFVKYAGRRTADEVILDLASEEQLRGGPARGAHHVLVVTNDRALRDLLVAKGARTASLQWLVDRMGLPVLQSAAPGNRRPTIGAGKPPAGGGGPNPAGRDDDAARKGWKPGRGATAKTGTAKKVARHKRHPRMGA